MSPTGEAGEVVETSPWLVHTFVDGGGEPWAVLQPLLRRRMAALQPGSIMTVVSTAPQVGECITDWCRGDGHDLCEVQQSEGCARFWVRKR